jgi:hypothetical protein
MRDQKNKVKKPLTNERSETTGEEVQIDQRSEEQGEETSNQ